MSLLKLHKVKDFSAHCISLGGVCDLALGRFIKENPHITKLTLALDNDEVGRFACEQIRQKYCSQYEIKRHLPENKDFNDDLVKMYSAASNVRSSHEQGGRYFFEETQEESEAVFSQ